MKFKIQEILSINKIKMTNKTQNNKVCYLSLS